MKRRYFLSTFLLVGLVAACVVQAQTTPRAYLFATAAAGADVTVTMTTTVKELPPK